MKKQLAAGVLLLILTLSGCSVKQAAALESIQCPEEPEQPAFYLIADVPGDAVLTASADEGRSAVFQHRDYTVVEEIFTADSLDAALERVSGRTQDSLQLLHVSDFPHDAYRFAWTAAGDEGETACSAALFTDGEFYYSLMVQCDAALEKQYRTVFSDLLASASLEAV